MEALSDSVSSYSLNIFQCVTLKLCNSNYLMWKTQFESFLSSQMLLGFINGDTPRPAPTKTIQNGDQMSTVSNPDFVKWIKIDNLVMSWLFGSLTEDALRSVYGLCSAQDVWISFAKRYNRVSATRKFGLQKRLQTCSRSGKKFDEYLREIQMICDQLDSIGSPLTEQEKIYAVLSGLEKEYDSEESKKT